MWELYAFLATAAYEAVYWVADRPLARRQYRQEHGLLHGQELVQDPVGKHRE